jgi:hypothetical protein
LLGNQLLHVPPSPVRNLIKTAASAYSSGAARRSRPKVLRSAAGCPDHFEVRSEVSRGRRTGRRATGRLARSQQGSAQASRRDPVIRRLPRGWVRLVISPRPPRPARSPRTWEMRVASWLRRTRAALRTDRGEMRRTSAVFSVTCVFGKFAKTAGDQFFAQLRRRSKWNETTNRGANRAPPSAGSGVRRRPGGRRAAGCARRARGRQLRTACAPNPAGSGSVRSHRRDLPVMAGHSLTQAPVSQDSRSTCCERSLRAGLVPVLPTPT